MHVIIPLFRCLTRQMASLYKRKAPATAPAAVSTPAAPAPPPPPPTLAAPPASAPREPIFGPLPPVPAARSQAATVSSRSSSSLDAVAASASPVLPHTATRPWLRPPPAFHRLLVLAAPCEDHGFAPLPPPVTPAASAAQAAAPAAAAAVNAAVVNAAAVNVGVSPNIGVSVSASVSASTDASVSASTDARAERARHALSCCGIDLDSNGNISLTSDGDTIDDASNAQINSSIKTSRSGAPAGPSAGVVRQLAVYCWDMAANTPVMLLLRDEWARNTRHACDHSNSSASSSSSSSSSVGSFSGSRSCACSCLPPPPGPPLVASPLSAPLHKGDIVHVIRPVLTHLSTFYNSSSSSSAAARITITTPSAAADTTAAASGPGSVTGIVASLPTAAVASIAHASVTVGRMAVAVAVQGRRSRETLAAALINAINDNGINSVAGAVSLDCAMTATDMFAASVSASARDTHAGSIPAAFATITHGSALTTATGAGAVSVCDGCSLAYACLQALHSHSYSLPQSKSRSGGTASSAASAGVVFSRDWWRLWALSVAPSLSVPTPTDSGAETDRSPYSHTHIKHTINTNNVTHSTPAAAVAAAVRNYGPLAASAASALSAVLDPLSSPSATGSSSPAAPFPAWPVPPLLLTVTARHGLLVLHPDLLLSPTVVSTAMGCVRRAVLTERLGETPWAAGGAADMLLPRTTAKTDSRSADASASASAGANLSGSGGSSSRDATTKVVDKKDTIKADAYADDEDELAINQEESLYLANSAELECDASGPLPLPRRFPLTAPSYAAALGSAAHAVAQAALAGGDWRARALAAAADAATEAAARAALACGGGTEGTGTATVTGLVLNSAGDSDSGDASGTVTPSGGVFGGVHGITVTPAPVPRNKPNYNANTNGSSNSNNAAGTTNINNDDVF